MGKRRLSWSIAAGSLPVAGWLLYSSTGRDDAYITYWAARMLATRGEILNYNGERLEQSSSLLHTVVLAIGERLTPFSVPALGYGIGIAFGVATALLAAGAAERLREGAGTTAAALVGTTAYIVYWAFGGLETTLAAFTLLLVLSTAASVVQGRRGLASLAGFAGASLLFVTSRPESGAVLIAVLAGAVVLSYAPRVVRVEFGGARSSWAMLATAVGAFAVVTIARRAYFGAFFPQPVSAKVRGVPIGDGLRYAWTWITRPYVLIPLVLLLPAALAFVRNRNPRAALLWLGLAASTGSVVAGGGDWMEAGRMLVGSIAIASVLVAAWIATLPRAAIVAVALVAVQVAGLLHVARRDSTGRPAAARIVFPAPRSVIDSISLESFERSDRVHVRDGAFVDELEDVMNDVAHVRSRPILATGQAGMVPYFLLQRLDRPVRLIDIGSLTTDDFDRCAHARTKSALGSNVPYAYWFEHTRECGVPFPDVIFGRSVGVKGRRLGPRYVTVYTQPDVPISSTSRLLPGARVTAGLFIAVRRELVSAVDIS